MESSKNNCKFRQSLTTLIATTKKYTMSINSFGRRFLCCFMIIFLIQTSSWSQRTITGFIKSQETGEELIGATVSVYGSTQGTVSSYDGSYKLTVPDQADSLQVSFVGFTPRVVVISDNDIINVVLDSGVSLGEFMVTATRRVSKVQKIGIAVNAFSGTQLRANNVVRTEDLSTVTPGLSINQAGGAPVSGLVAIRGVAQNDFAAHLESANVVFKDDAYQPSNGSSLRALYDIERVEVLKGPQGTLFGRNATGGLIHILTKDPHSDHEAYLDLQLAEFGTYIAEGAVNVPIGEASGFRLSGYLQHNNGYIENSLGLDQGENDIRSLRAKLLLKPDDQWAVKFIGEYYRNAPNAAGGAFPTGGMVGADGLGVFRTGSTNNDAGYIDADGDIFTGEFDFDGIFERTDWSFISDISYQTGDWEIKSITSYNNVDVPYEEDNDLTPFDIAIFRQTTRQNSFTQEFRASADFEQMRLTSGLYYLNISGDYSQGYQINNLGNFNNALGVPSTVFGLDEGTTLIPFGQNQFAEYAVNTNSVSAFTQAEVDLSEQFTLTGGLRFTWDQRDYVYENFCEVVGEGSPLGPCTPGDPSTIAFAGRITDDHADTGLSARLQLDYKANKNWLLYGSYNRGYKGFNYNAGFGGAAQVEFVRFDGEQIDAFELGSKLDFLAGRGRFNISGFHSIYNNYQAFDQRGLSFILTNVDATIQGIEGELTLRGPKKLQGNVGVILLSTNVEDIDIGGEAVDRRAPQAANFEFNFGLSKEFALGNGAIKTVLNGNYTGDYFAQLTNAPVTLVGDNWLVNGRIGYVPKSYKWEFSLFARNLFNTARLLYAFDITFAGNGLVEQIFGNPRVLGAQLKYRF